MKKNLLAVVVGLIFVASPPPEAQRDIPYSWQGYVEVSQKMLPSAGAPTSGEVTTRWKLMINWKESKRNDIKDRRGNLVGQLVKLEDNGSSWEGTLTGGYAQKGRDITYAGQGSGADNAIGFGWIYYSLSEKDPLKDILPNGSYCFGAGTGTVAAFQGKITYFDYSNIPARTSTSVWPAMLGYYVGGDKLGMPFGHVKGPDLPGPSSAESIREAITRWDQIKRVAQAANSWDTEARALEGGAMKGRYQRTALNGGLINDVSWDVSKLLDILCEIDKPDEKWRPQGGDDSNSVTIKARIKEQEELKGKWRFTLVEVSRERGIALNQGDDTDYDLAFTEGQSGYKRPDERNPLVLESTESKNEASIEVKSLDYGAWGKLKAEVNLEGRWYRARAADGKDYITIPLDDDGNHIADRWEWEWSLQGKPENADEDDMPAGVGEESARGDGFSNYEEYRGFFVKGKWTETGPFLKDLFILDEAYHGVGYFDKLELAVHLIRRDEIDLRTKNINFNRGWASQGPQNGLHLRDSDLADRDGWVLLGEATGGPAPPNQIKEVLIDVAAVYKTFDDLDSVIAHELGHAVNIWHHGESDHDGLARRGGLWSGDVSCVMRYSRPKEYKGVDGKKYPFPIDEGATPRVNFCSTKTGTGINTPGERTGPDGHPYPVAADATRDNCRKSVRLKGRMP
jgi:hypothetical protein